MNSRTERSPARPGRKRPSLRSSLRYRFDAFMERGGVSIFVSLLLAFIVVFVVLAILRGVLLKIEALPGEDRTLWSEVYMAFLQLTDPGNMGEDQKSSAWFKLLAVFGGLFGLVGVSALTAFITTALHQKLQALRRGHSKVIENGHLIILGWSEHRVIEILRELIIANESESDACVVILSRQGKVEVDDVLRLHLPETKSTRLVTRSGNVSSLANLDVVSIETCKSVIALARCDESATEREKADSDAKVIQAIQAVISIRSDEPDLPIVAEVFDPTYRGIIDEAFPDNNVLTIEADDTLARILVQTSRSVGLSVVYNELLSFDGCEMYFFPGDALRPGDDAPWGDKTFGELAFHFSDGVPIGLRDGDGRITVNPAADRRMAADDHVLILAEDDSMVRFSSEPVIDRPPEIDLAGGRLERRVERELLLGWTEQAPIVIRQYADYVEPGSQIDIMLRAPSARVRSALAALGAEVPQIEIRLIEKDRLSTQDLRQVVRSVEPYDNILILAESEKEGDERQIDSRNIVTLLLLREIFRQDPQASADTRLITEILDSQNYHLVAQAGVKDVIISNRLISMILAQICESPDIKKVYDQLFQADGSEIYLKPASLYFPALPDAVSFADMIQIAQKRKEVCLGVKIKALESDTEQNCGVTLNPAKSRTMTLQPDDSLVVLAEDET